MKSLIVLLAALCTLANARRNDGVRSDTVPTMGSREAERSASEDYAYAGGRHAFNVNNVNFAAAPQHVSIVQNHNDGSNDRTRPSYHGFYAPAQGYRYGSAQGNHHAQHDAEGNIGSLKPATVGTPCGRFDELPCSGLRNARCMDNLCTCQPGYVASKESMCVRLASVIGDMCSSDVQCEQLGQHAMCIRGRCICEPMNTVAIENCLGEPRDSMSRWELPDIVCATTRRLSESCCDSRQCQHRVQDSECRSGRCVCSERFVAIGDRHCMRKASQLGEPCSMNSQCGDIAGASCSMAGKCHCDGIVIQSASLSSNVATCLPWKDLGDKCQDKRQCRTPNSTCDSSSQCSCDDGSTKHLGFNVCVDSTVDQSTPVATTTPVTTTLTTATPTTTAAPMTTTKRTGPTAPSVKCFVPPATVDVRRVPSELTALDVGESFVDTCAEDFRRSSGDTTRSCLFNGSLSGVPFVCQNVSLFWRSVWAVNSTNHIFFRLGVTSTTPLGTAWQHVPGNLSQVSVGNIGVWGVSATDNVFYRSGVTRAFPTGTGWVPIIGNLKQVSVGAGQVWGVNAAGDAYFRTLITKSTPQGSGWQRAGGNFKHVAVGKLGIWGLNRKGVVYIRSGVTAAIPQGTEWKLVGSSTFKQFSVGTIGVWGAQDSNVGWLRTGVSAKTPSGSKWARTDSFKDVSAGGEAVWVVGVKNNIAIRNGVNVKNPRGTGWTRVGNEKFNFKLKFKHVSVDSLD